MIKLTQVQKTQLAAAICVSFCKGSCFTSMGNNCTQSVINFLTVGLAGIFPIDHHNYLPRHHQEEHQ